MLLCNIGSVASQKSVILIAISDSSRPTTSPVMNNFERLQGVMPFAVMLYLMMTLAQMHGTQMFWRGAVSARAGGFVMARSLSDFGRELGRAAAADKRVLLFRDPSHYAVGSFVPP
jgi:hypothetical protein